MLLTIRGEGEGRPAILVVAVIRLSLESHGPSVNRSDRALRLRGLSANEMQRVEEHLAACPECEDRLQDEVELPTAMRSSSVAEVRRIVESGRKKAAKQ